MLKKLRKWFWKRLDLISELYKLDELNKAVAEQAYLDRERLEVKHDNLLRAFLFYNGGKVILSREVQQLALDPTIGVDSKLADDGCVHLSIIDLMDGKNDQEKTNHSH